MRPRHRTAIVPVLLALASGCLLAACSGSSAGPGNPTPAGVASTTTPAPARGAAPDAGVSTGATSRAHAAAGTVGETVAPTAPLVVRTGSLSLRVARARIVSVFDDVSSDAAAMGGFVASSSTTAANDAGGASLVVRVPSDDFATLVARVDSLGRVEAQALHGTDVTGESIDLQASLENLRSEEAALRALLSRAGSIPSILRVQNQLFSVQGDIEQLSAEEGSLANQVTYATLDVRLSPLPVHKAPVKHAAEGAFLRAVKLAGHNTAVAARAIVVALGWSFPLIVLAALGLCAWWLQRRSSRRRRSAPSPLAE